MDSASFLKRTFLTCTYASFAVPKSVNSRFLAVWRRDSAAAGVLPRTSRISKSCFDTSHAKPLMGPVYEKIRIVIVAQVVRLAVPLENILQNRYHFI